jgi:hypothetical protein
MQIYDSQSAKVPKLPSVRVVNREGLFGLGIDLGTNQLVVGLRADQLVAIHQGLQAELLLAGLLVIRRRSSTPRADGPTAANRQRSQPRKEASTEVDVELETFFREN